MGEVETGIVKMVTQTPLFTPIHAHVQRGLCLYCSSTLVYAGTCSGVFCITASTPCAMVPNNNLISSNHLSTVRIHATIAVNTSIGSARRARASDDALNCYYCISTVLARFGY